MEYIFLGIGISVIALLSYLGIRELMKSLTFKMVSMNIMSIVIVIDVKS